MLECPTAILDVKIEIGFVTFITFEVDRTLLSSRLVFLSIFRIGVLLDLEYSTRIFVSGLRSLLKRQC